MSGTDHLKHPDVHLPWSQWSEEEVVHIVLPYENACRWQSRRRHYNECFRHLTLTPNVAVHRVEIAYGDRPFEVTGDHPLDIQLRTDSVMFHKENMINVGVASFPAGWKYGGYWDGDFHSTRMDWALESIHLLQQHSFVQLFSSYADLSAACSTSDDGHRPYRMNSSFAWNYTHQRTFLEKRKNSKQESGGRGVKSERFPFGFTPGATGGGWAWRHDAFDAVGGLYDKCILGSGDEHIAMGLIGADNVAVEMKASGEAYISDVRRWQENAYRRLNAHPGRPPVGCVDNFCTHFFHGSKLRRGYSDRRLFLKKHDFNTSTDIQRDWRGVWQWTGNKPLLRDDVWQYFVGRKEDDPTFITEKFML